jgi:hypothetical protein
LISPRAACAVTDLDRDQGATIPSLNISASVRRTFSTPAGITMNFHSLTFGREQPHLFPATPSPGRRALTALLPLMSVVATTIPGLPMDKAALALCMSLGIMGIISPHGSGPGPVYTGSGFPPGTDYWRLGAIFGAYYLLLGVPVLLFIV